MSFEGFSLWYGDRVQINDTRRVSFASTTFKLVDAPEFKVTLADGLKSLK